MRESIPTARYSPVCNVLRQWKTSSSLLIESTDSMIILKTEKHLKNEQRSKDAAAKKRVNTSGVGKINKHCEDIYKRLYH